MTEKKSINIRKNSAINEIFIDSQKAVLINNKIYSSENLDVNTFRNGDTIAEAASDEDWKYCSENRIPAWSYFHGADLEAEKPCKLYNAYCITDKRKIAPFGWQILDSLPNVEKRFLLCSSYLKQIDLNKFPHILTDDIKNAIIYSTNYKAIPLGFRDQNGFFFNTDHFSCWILNNKVENKEIVKNYHGLYEIKYSNVKIIKVSKIGVSYGISLSTRSRFALSSYELGNGYIIRLIKQ